MIKNVIVDIVHYPYDPITPYEVIDGIKMYSNKDIAAMKINAILGRGVKKDSSTSLTTCFWDLAMLLE